MTSVIMIAPLNAENFESGDASEGQVLTADGEGGASWQDQAGGLPDYTPDITGRVLKLQEYGPPHIPPENVRPEWVAPSGEMPDPSVSGPGDVLTAVAIDGPMDPNTAAWMPFPLPVPADGLANQVITADGAGGASWQDAAGGGGLPYAVYSALLTQSGENAPVATVLENTLGGEVVWSRLGIGLYEGLLTNAFPSNKSICVNALTRTSDGIMNNVFGLCSISHPSSLIVEVIYLGDFSYMDDQLLRSPIIIHVYP